LSHFWLLSLNNINRLAVLLSNLGGYDADWFRDALIDMGISPCIPSRRGRKEAIPHDANLYRQRHKIENMFARLKDWRRISTRYDRCPILFLSACALAATVIYWL
jgi:transposase